MLARRFQVGYSGLQQGLRPQLPQLPSSQPTGMATDGHNAFTLPDGRVIYPNGPPPQAPPLGGMLPPSWILGRRQGMVGPMGDHGPPSNDDIDPGGGGADYNPGDYNFGEGGVEFPPAPSEPPLNVYNHAPQAPPTAHPNNNGTGVGGGSSGGNAGGFFIPNNNNADYHSPFSYLNWPGGYAGNRPFWTVHP
jgi:hypothetical protein